MGGVNFTPWAFQKKEQISKNWKTLSLGSNGVEVHIVGGKNHQEFRPPGYYGRRHGAPYKRADALQEKENIIMGEKNFPEGRGWYCCCVAS